MRSPLVSLFYMIAVLRKLPVTSSSLVLKIRCAVFTVRMVVTAVAVSFGIHRAVVSP